jgi:AcrR family transcriptional regulator
MQTPNRPKTRGSYKKSEVSRQQVLDAAVRSLAKRGYAKTSVSDIAQAAGMSKGAVHYHFESKDDLIARVAEHCGVVARERLRQAWDAPGTPVEKIRGAMVEMRKMRKEGTAELRVLADLAALALHDPRLRTLLGRMFEVNRKEIVEYLTESLTGLGIKSKIPVHVLPRLLLGVLDGLAMQDYFDPAAPGDDAAVDQALETIALSLFEM